MLRIRVPYAPPERMIERLSFFVLFCLVDVAGGCLDEVGCLVNLESLESLGSLGSVSISSGGLKILSKYCSQTKYKERYVSNATELIK